jgi:hypothetical protein
MRQNSSPFVVNHQFYSAYLKVWKKFKDGFRGKILMLEIGKQENRPVFDSIFSQTPASTKFLKLLDTSGFTA